MTRYTKLTAVAAAALLAAPAFAAMTTDANLELDNDYRSEIDSTPNTNNRVGGMSQGGRVGTRPGVGHRTTTTRMFYRIGATHGQGQWNFSIHHHHWL